MTHKQTDFPLSMADEHDPWLQWIAREGDTRAPTPDDGIVLAEDPPYEPEQGLANGVFLGAVLLIAFALGYVVGRWIVPAMLVIH